jgi:Uma2 family endonuclease
MSKKQPLTHALKRMMRWLNEVFEWAFQEAPINVAPQDNPTSEPEPDAIVLKPEFGGVRPELPRPSELALVVEVSDTTLTFDLTVKAGLYARAGITDYWVLDLNGRRMIVHREPEAGVYKSVVAYAEIESVARLAAPQYSLVVRDVLV